MKKWLVAIPVLVAVLLVVSWVSDREERAIRAVLNAVPSIDSIHVIDAGTGEEVQSFIKVDAAFSELVSVYEFPYVETDTAMDALFDNAPVAYIEFREGSETHYKATLYSGMLEEEKLLAASNVEASQSATVTYRYSYSPEGSETSYYLGEEKTHHIFGIGSEHVKLIDSIVSH
ncbi:hypothetical protein CF394_08080 [Tetzosporium hominis]|uniref:Uncharacterized protein n=1 Tax=Tetzosporium hominis TaxID=2020506 RepID=A0A264W396_9BACL|nr:hypothetical protein [Tetzosporium hominis]OZS78039.1 hypothetical protein CF394_08080 [Tetzosporium hominis]